MKTQLQKRIFDYLRTVDKASPRKIARELGESRHKVKEAMQPMYEAGILENLAVRIPIREDIFRELFITAARGPRRRPRRIESTAAPEAPATGAQTEVRRI